MGPCSVNSVVLPDGNPCYSGVLVERCRYLEESKCIGICINTCKIPTQVSSLVKLTIYMSNIHDGGHLVINLFLKFIDILQRFHGGGTIHGTEF
jgi:Beta-carotene isomerase D27-like, C-terminal